MDTTLRGIFRGHNFTKFADTPCGGCECVVMVLHARALCGWKDRCKVHTLPCMEEVAVKTKSNRVGAAARQS